MHVIEVIPILEIIPSVGEKSLETEIVVGPGQTRSEADGDSGQLDDLIGVVGILVCVGVVVCSEVTLCV